MTLHNPDAPESSEPAAQAEVSGPPEAEGEDYYFDGPYLVFTEAYHRRRGFCCQSGCRHCPYGFGKNTSGTSKPAEPDTD